MHENCVIGNCCYDYIDENGVFLYQVVRLYPKKFFQRRWVKNQWVYNLDNTRRVLYHLPEVINSQIVFIVEGEKDVETLRNKIKQSTYDFLLNASVTTCGCGSNSWKEEYNRFLQNKIVYIIPDNDKPGHKLAKEIAIEIFSLASFVRIVTLPGIRDTEDITDFFCRYHFSLDNFLAVCYNTNKLTEDDIKIFQADIKPKKQPKKHVHDANRIDTGMIQTALKYPISSLVDVDATGKAFCINPDHIDEHRSMDTRNNFAYCYGCGFHADVIAVAQKVGKCSFYKAVESLFRLMIFDVKKNPGG
ncbi:hypothetical protein KKE60_06020 [Patescibacteria group bacterium]|nr:hypothetical protein [Patescibacteria group bacterium]